MMKMSHGFRSISYAILLLAVVDSASCNSEEQSSLASDFKLTEKLVNKEIQRIPQVDFRRIHTIYLARLHKIYRHRTWEQAVADQFRQPNGVLSLVSDHLGKKAFELFYNSRIQKPCQAVKSIYNSHKDGIERILQKFPRQYEATHLATVKYMSTTYCDEINAQKFRDKIYWILSNE